VITQKERFSSRFVGDRRVPHFIRLHALQLVLLLGLLTYLFKISAQPLIIHLSRKPVATELAA